MGIHGKTNLLAGADEVLEGCHEGPQILRHVEGLLDGSRYLVTHVVDHLLDRVDNGVNRVGHLFGLGGGKVESVGCSCGMGGWREKWGVMGGLMQGRKRNSTGHTMSRSSAKYL